MTESKKTGLAFFGLTEKDAIKSKKDNKKVNFILGKSSSSKLSKLKPIVDSPVQTKIIASISILLLFGGIIHTFIDKFAPDRPLVKIIIYSLICFIVLVLMYVISDNNELWAILLSVCISFLLWFYVFYKEWKEIQDAVQSGEHSFICNPVGKCKTDNFHGLYSSDKNYKYKDEETNKIPSTALDITNQEQATYMFWCNVSYKAFSNETLYNKQDNPIIEHGNNITTYLSSLDPKIQFKIDDDAYMETNYSFDNWTHYCITMNGKVVELYKNASLEKTFVLNQNKQITKTDMNILKNSVNNDKEPLYKLAFLTFANSVYTPEKIYDIYNNQYNTIAYEYDTNACVECKNPKENTEDTECVEEDIIYKIQESCEAIQSSLQATDSGTSQNQTPQTP